MASTSLQRARQDKMIAGVVGGLARRFGMDPTVLRIIYVLVSLFSAAFPGILVYLILWILMPQEPVPGPDTSGGQPPI
jgi:phage shock protein PspC (stress-responsive transcriptional regulator)